MLQHRVSRHVMENLRRGTARRCGDSGMAVVGIRPCRSRVIRTEEEGVDAVHGQEGVG